MYFVVVIEFLYIDYTTKSFKNTSFQNKKPFSKKPKGWKWQAPPIGQLQNF
jgi:CRISPR/Cas system-associated exonuclease Cas4 (RecB family)